MRDETESQATDSAAYAHQELTHDIIGAAIAVHRALGAGFLERVYETALALELSDRGIEFRQQCPVQVRYKGRVVGHYQADLIVADKVICEIKALEELSEPHEAQLLSYLKGTGLRVGLLLNFGRSTLQTKRKVV